MAVLTILACLAALLFLAYIPGVPSAEKRRHPDTQRPLVARQPAAVSWRQSRSYRYGMEQTAGPHDSTQIL